MKECFERLHLAVGQDPKILTSIADLDTTEGNDPKYLAELGLEAKHLKRLERLGIAFKGYTKNIWLTGETMPNGKVVEEGSSYRGKGMKLVWLLVKS